MHTVQAILERKGFDVAGITEDASVLEAARMMNLRRIGALVVTRGESVVGIITERDVLNRVVARQLAPGHTRVGDVMTTPVAVCAPSSSRADCRAVMKEKRIRHLPVVDDGRLVGIISIGDLIEDEGAEAQETIEYMYEYMHGAFGARQPSPTN
ncbi:MAG: CBS domain-containing protein [Phycisphaerales bacterium]|nr:CBS domain-containing protein [Phycisphaerales bacterium]